MPPSPHALPSADLERARQLRRVAASGLLGTAVEFYDFLVYGTVAALVFGELFFPGAAPAAAPAAAFAPSPPAMSPARSAASSSGTSATGSAASPCCCSRWA